MKNTNSTTGNYTIRLLKTSDWHMLWQYINQISKEKTFISFQGEHISQKQEKNYVKSMVANGKQHQAIVLVVESSQGIIGTAHLTLKPRSQNHVADLGISIHKNHRDMGLGRKLMLELINAGKQQLPSLKIITLQLLSNNSRALHLYQDLGFVEIGRIPNGHQYQGDFVDTIIMYKSL